MTNEASFVVTDDPDVTSPLAKLPDAKLIEKLWRLDKRLVQVRPDAEPWLDIFSAARPGPQSRDQLAPSHVSQVALTVSRAPEVMVKVTGGATNLGAVSAHLKYISRNGVQPVETDGGESLKGRESLESLIDDWHLDLSSGQYRRARSGKPPPRSVKLVHHIVLSMPAPPPPDKVLAAARQFARERFECRSEPADRPRFPELSAERTQQPLVDVQQQPEA